MKKMHCRLGTSRAGLSPAGLTLRPEFLSLNMPPDIGHILYSVEVLHPRGHEECQLSPLCSECFPKYVNVFQNSKYLVQEYSKKRLSQGQAASGFRKNAN